MRLETLGGFRLEQAGESVTSLGSRKVEGLFVYLALNPRRHPRELLAEMLWDDRTQKQAQSNLRRILTGLRKQVGEHVAVTRETVAVRLDRGLWVDARALEADTEPLRGPIGSLTAEQLAAAEAALALYRGDFMAGFSVREASGFEAWLTAEREGWRQRALDMLEQLALHWEHMGEMPGAIATVQRVLQLDPLRESAYRRLMRLLARQGRRAEALRQYERCRQQLWDELGVMPAPETEAVYQAVVDGEIAADADGQSPAAFPKQPQPESDTNGSVPSAKDPEEIHAPVILSGIKKRHNLPAQSSPLIGRESELAALLEMVTDTDMRMVTITGPGGMGKTRLALAVAEEAAEKGKLFPDGVFFVPLAPPAPAEGIPMAMAEQLQIVLQGNAPVREQVLSYLASQHMLLVMDNLEHLVDDSSLLVDILQGAPGIRLLVTSREQLHLGGESIFRLGGLSYPQGESLDMPGAAERLLEYGAAALFHHHARLLQPEFQLSAEDAPPMLEICQRVQGMPLALMMAAGWVELLSLPELAAEIKDNIDLLVSEQRDLPARQRSARAVFATSWKWLSAEEQTAFARLSVFRGSFDHKAARAVAGVSLLLLRHLVDKSLLTPAEGKRYALHQLLRQFAAEELAQRQDVAEVQQAHASYYLEQLAHLEADLKGARQTEAVRAIKADFANIEAGWSWALEHGDFSAVDSALDGLYLYHLLGRRAVEGQFLLEQARRRGHDLTSRLLGRLQSRLAVFRAECGSGDDTIEAMIDSSLAIARRHDDEREAVMATMARGWYLMRRTLDLEAAREQFLQALAYFEKIDEPYFLALLCHRIGYCYAEGRLDEFVAWTQRSLDLSLQRGIVSEAIQAQENLGYGHMALGNLDKSKSSLQSVIRLQQSSGVIKDTTLEQTMLALVDLLSGDIPQARKSLPPHQQIVRGKLPIAIAYSKALWALLAVLEGQLDDAETLARQSLEHVSNYHAELIARWAWSMVEIGRNEMAAAARNLAQALAAAEASQPGAYMTRVLPVAAVILARQDRPARAVQVLSLAHHHPASQIGWLKHWQAGFTLQDELEERLGLKVFQTAWKQGEKLDLEETVRQLIDAFSDEE